MTVMTENQEMFEMPGFRPKDPISALTHFAGFIAAIIGMPVLLIRAGVMGNSMPSMISYGIFMLSMILLYGASTSYHSFNISGAWNMVLKRIDHCSIFLLIAGTYTPVMIAGLGREGYGLLVFIWLFAAAGILFKIFWVTCPKWVSSVIYCFMGWACLIKVPALWNALPHAGFLWLLAGGIFYTLGSVIYALKPALFEYRIPGFGNHELFHCFVLAGSFCHYILVLNYLTCIG